MIPRPKLIAAVLGLIVAAGAMGDASARVIDRTIVKKTIITHAVAAPRLHRVVVQPAARSSAAMSPTARRFLSGLVSSLRASFVRRSS